MSLPSTAPISPQSLSPATRLIVCERTGEWTAALRRELAPVCDHPNADGGVKIWECRRLAEAWTALAETRAAFLVAEATSKNLGELVERVSWLRRDFPQARAAVVADRSLAKCEWIVREAGAIHFLTSPRQLPPLVGLVVRHLANPGAPGLPAQTLTEQIWASLPWARHGT